MKKYVTIDKRSKKAQKEYYSKQRHTWGNINPVTRSMSGGKIYNRNKDKQERRKTGGEFSDEFVKPVFSVRRYSADKSVMEIMISLTGTCRRKMWTVIPGIFY